MNINFLNSVENPDERTRVKISAGLDDKIFVEFWINISNIDSKESEIFTEKMDECESYTLHLSDNEYIEYNYDESKALFNLHDIKISFVNNNAPECLFERSIV